MARFQNGLAAASLMILASAVSLGVAHAADVTAKAGGSIIDALTIEKTEDLYFGTIVPSATASDTVRINTGGELICGASLTCLGDDASVAAFSVRGERRFTYSVSLPEQVVLSNGSDTMTIISLDSSIGSQGTIAPNGRDAFTVGGTLSVAASQAPGDYSGTFNVTVEYN